MAGVAKVIKRVFLWSAAVVVFFTGLLLLLAYLFEEDIKRAAVAGLNQNLAVPVQVGQIDFSLLRHFPNAALSFSEVKIQENVAGSKKNIAEVQYISLFFNPFDILNKNYRLKRVLIKDANIALQYDKNGQPNYIIWKKSESQPKQPAQALQLALDKIDFLRVDVNFEDAASGQKAVARIEEGTFSGNFADDLYDLSAHLRGKVQQWQSGKMVFVKEKNIELQSVVQINNAKDLYTIKDTRLNVEGAPFRIGGQISAREKVTFFDLNAQAEETNIKTLLALLPVSYRTAFDDFKSNGKIWFNAKVKGEMSEKNNPVLSADFGISRATISRSGSPVQLTNTSFTGSFTNGKKQNATTSQLIIKDFRGLLNGKSVQGGFSMLNFADPFVTADLKVEAELADIHAFYKIPGLEKIDGLLFADVSYSGNIGNSSNLKNLKSHQLKGAVAIQRLNLQAPNAPEFSNVSGRFNFDRNRLEVSDLKGFAGQSDFLLNGNFNNIASYLFDDEVLDVQTKFASSYIRLKDFMSRQPAATTTAVKDTSAFRLPKNIRFDFALDVKKLEYEKFTASQVNGGLLLENGEATFNNLRLMSMNGRAVFDGKIRNMPRQQLLTSCKAQLDGIEVSELFRQLEDFGQQYITHHHLKGKLNAQVDFSMLWNSDLSADMKSIVTLAKLEVNNGQLIKFAPVVEMGKFIKTNRLDHIYFEKLTNEISIRNEQIVIPQMQLNSSVMNMSIAGTQTFNNKLDFKVDLNASQLVLGKVQSYEDEFGIVEVSNPNGGIRLFLHIYGTTDNMKIAYDGNALKKNIGKTLKSEGKEISKLISGGTSTEKAADEKPKKKENLNQVRDDYELSWDDDDEETPVSSQKSGNESSGKVQQKAPLKNIFRELRNH